MRRFVHVNSINVGYADSRDLSEGYAVYLRAKHAAEQHIFARNGLDWTVLRPGVLTDDRGDGTVELTTGNTVGPNVARFDTVARNDVAATLMALLDRPDTAGRIYVVVSGETPIERLWTPSLRISLNRPPTITPAIQQASPLWRPIPTHR